MKMTLLLLLGICPVSTSADRQENAPALLPLAGDLLDNIPEDFPRFWFAEHDADAQWLSRYLWYHFSTRGGHGPVLFNQEYLTTSDLWMAGALHPGWPAVIQTIMRDDLLAIRIDREGYVHTHQHYSHAHEHGWPFPMWVQAPTGPQGLTAGWHFQHDGIGWVWDTLRRYPDSPFWGKRATQGWRLENVRSSGIVDNKWQLEATGPSPAVVTPESIQIDAFNSPFLQLRWTRSGSPPNGALPYIEWRRVGDSDFHPDRRVYFDMDSGNPDYESVTGAKHSMIVMHRHPLWEGRIQQLRIALAPGEENVRFALDSFFTAYDTRHSINNPIYISACWNYYRWTGDLAFLRTVINRMRLALRYQQTEMNGRKLNRIRNEWPGHDGLTGILPRPDGTKTIRHGHGIGNNYWDLLPFGWDDMYATAQYYAATHVMAQIEQAVLDHPEWDVPRGALAFDPQDLENHADAVKRQANRLFWRRDTKRFAACIDKEGNAHDYGFTFLNLDAIWYGLATDRHPRDILDWLAGNRIIQQDTSTGNDIYHWRFGPRATTRRNVEWYGHGWTAPESIPWGGQVQDGGAVLGFTFYDLIARVRVLGPDNAWTRLREILEWEREVWADGGYRAYYADGKRGTTLQGGGTAGGIGIDHEFYESSLMPSIVIYGFLGLDPNATDLVMRPQLPAACPNMGAANILYRGVRLDIRADPHTIHIRMKDQPREPLRLDLGAEWMRKDARETGPVFLMREPGLHRFMRETARE